MQAIRLQPDLMQRRYSDAVEGCSTAAGHVLWMLVTLKQRNEVVVTTARLLDYVHSTGRESWTGEQLRGYLDELLRNRCIEWVDEPAAAA